MYKPMDTEAQALIGKIGIYNNHSFSTEQKRSEFLLGIKGEWKRLNNIPVLEFSITVWDDLNLIINEI